MRRLERLRLRSVVANECRQAFNLRRADHSIRSVGRNLAGETIVAALVVRRDGR